MPFDTSASRSARGERIPGAVRPEPAAQRPCRRARHFCGFGLVGVVITVLILALTVPPLAGLFSTSLRTVTHSEAALFAALAASDLMERVTDSRFAKANLGNTLEVPGAPGLALMEPFASRYRAKATIEITRAEGHTDAATGREGNGLTQVAVKVTWEELSTPQSIEMRTLVADVAALRPKL